MTHAATPDEVLAIMDTLEQAGQQKAVAAVALMFFAGLRPGEARGVCWEDYDGKHLLVRQSVWRTYTTSPKTQSSVKPVPVIEPLGGILAALREVEGNPTSGPILRGSGDKPLDLDKLGQTVVRPTLKTVCCLQTTRIEAQRRGTRLSARHFASRLAGMVLSAARSRNGRGFSCQGPARRKGALAAFKREYN